MTSAVANAVPEMANDALPDACGSGRHGVVAVSVTGNPADAHSTVEMFVDLENVRHSAERLGCTRPDYGRLVRAAGQEFAQRLGAKMVDDPARKAGDCPRPGESGPYIICRRFWAFVGRPENVHPADRRRVQGWERWVAGLRQRYGFEVLSVPIDFHGFHLRAEDREKSRSEAERRWQPVEKGVDVALAMHMVARAEAADRPDSIILVGGDADVGPALQKVRSIEPPIGVVVASFSNALSRVYYKRNSVGYQWSSEPIILDPYVAPLAQGGKNVPASGRTDFQGEGARIVEAKTMSTVIAANGDRGGAKRAGRNGVPQKSYNADPDVGRIEAACPKRGELQVYRKADGLMGARVFCEDDGGKYGVSSGVRKQFPNVGTCRGMAYVDEGRGLVFKFVADGASGARDSILTISAQFGRVYVPPSLARGKSLEHGALVAFHWRLENGNGDGKTRRRAESLHPLDGDHLPLVARLIASGKLVFPAHAGVLDVFLDGLASGDVPPQEAGRFRAALDRLAEDPGVPANLQMTVRVERTRLALDGPETSLPATPQTPPPAPPAGKAKGKTGRAAKPTGHNPAAGDVGPVDLQLD